MTTSSIILCRLDREVVEAYRLDRYDNIDPVRDERGVRVVEAYRLDRYDNLETGPMSHRIARCRSLSFG